MELKRLAFNLVELKEAGDQWEFSGYASTFGNVDLGGDIVMPGAFDATLAEGQHKPLLFAHNDGIIIGGSKRFSVDDRGLFGVWDLVDTTHGTDVYKLLKRGHLDALSIGYWPRKYSFDDEGNRLLEVIDLIEVSAVASPMNPDARITDVKSRPFEVHSADVQVAIREYLERCKAGLAQRQKDGRDLSQARKDQLAAMSGSLRSAADQVDALLVPPPAPEVINVGAELRRRRYASAGLTLERPAS